MIVFRFFYILWIVHRYRLRDFLRQSNKKSSLMSFSFRKTQKTRSEGLRLACEKLGPIFVKFGQILSTRPDLFPADVIEELTKLQDSVPAFPYFEVEKIVKNSWGGDIPQFFCLFDKTPIASASVAQVHYAKFLNGQEVAIKVLRPGIRKQISLDLRLLRFSAYLLEIFSEDASFLRPREIVKEFALRLNNELDLTLEAANLSKISHNFRKDKTFILPKVYWQFSHQQVLVMSYMHGISLNDRLSLQSSGINLTKLAHQIIEIFFTQVLRDGFFHADLHPGNLMASQEGQYIALDFGIMGILSESDKRYLVRNFLAFFRQDYREIARVHVESGWVPMDVDLDQFDLSLRAVLEPLLNKPLQEISVSDVLLKVFHTVKKFGLIIQPQFTMLQKTLFNLEGLIFSLDANIDLLASSKPYLDRWMRKEFGVVGTLRRIRREWVSWNMFVPTIPSRIDLSLQDIRLLKKQNQIQAQELKTIRKLLMCLFTLCVLFMAMTWYILLL